MVIGMIAYLVSFIDDSSNEIWVAFRIHADKKKCRLHLCGLQDIENFWRPFRVGPVIKSQSHLVSVASTLVIQCWKLREFGVGRSKITVLVDSHAAHSIRARFVHCYDLPIADVSDGIGPAQYLQERPRAGVELEIRRRVQRIPNRAIFCSQAIQGNAACFLLPNFAQFVQECNNIKKPDRMLYIVILIVEVCVVTGSAYFSRLDSGT